MDKELAIELFKIIENCREIESDTRAIKFAIESWKRTIDKYIKKASNEEQHFLGGVKRFLSYNEYDMNRVVFFTYMENLISLFVRVPTMDLNKIYASENK